jgi:hypothetical protein
MTYFPDLSDYTYSRDFRPGANVGWLGAGHAFETADPTEEFLERLWSFCKISVARTRGLHDCEFCADEHAWYVKRNGEPLLLGSSEIRAFSMNGAIYAAPTLIYHYVSVHKYRPPDEFVRAIMDGLAPPAREYFNRLEELGLEWKMTSAPATAPIRQ